MNIDITLTNVIKIVPKFKGYFKREKKGSGVSFWNDLYWINFNFHFLCIILEVNNGR